MVEMTVLFIFRILCAKPNAESKENKNWKMYFVSPFIGCPPIQLPLTLLSSMSFSIVILYLAWNAFCLSAMRCCFAASIVSVKWKENIFVIVNSEPNELICSKRLYTLNRHDQRIHFFVDFRLAGRSFEATYSGYFARTESELRTEHVNSPQRWHPGRNVFNSCIKPFEL